MTQSSTNKQLMNLSLDELKKILSQDKQKVKKDYKEMEEKIKVIEKIKKVRKIGNKIKQGKIKPKVNSKKIKTKVNSKKIKTKVKPKKIKSKVVTKKIKSFEDYFEECIKNRKIPKDTPDYLRKALERAIKEYEQGIEIEKSALNEFAKKYIIRGKPGILPLEFFRNKKRVIKDFLRNHRNIKLRFILVCIMEKKEKKNKR